MSKKQAQAQAQQPQPPKMNASQKIEALENAFMAQNQQIEILAEEIDRLRSVVTSLTKRINASIQAAEQGGVSTQSVNQIILNENIKELEGKVQFLVDNGVMELNNDIAVSTDTFVVGRHIDSEGNVVNPRIQFAVKSIDPDLQSRLMNKKAGDVVSYDENEPSLEIVEIYQLADLNKKQEFDQNAQP